MKKMLAILCSLLTPILSMHARGTNPSNGSSSLGQGTNPASTAFGYNIGDFAQGGVVIWVTTDGQHGLVAAITDSSAGATWGPLDIQVQASSTYYGPLPTSTPSAPFGQYYPGYLDQQIILRSYNLNDYPAFKAAVDYAITIGGVTYDDWFLPSTTELFLMYSAIGVINQVSLANGGSAIGGAYWSSREVGLNNSFKQDVSVTEDGSNQSESKDNSYKVRAVRAF